MTFSDLDTRFMQRALELAVRGQGSVEPNPMVGAVIAQGDQSVGEGWHTRFGASHAEIDALRAAGDKAQGGTLYVTLEPCCHHGKTPPCTEAIFAAGIRRVVAAMQDPFPKVSGGGIGQLRSAGIQVEAGLLEPQARDLNAPYLKLLRSGRPWVIAKWAMTLDGRIATRGGYSKWISGEASREVVHVLRGRVDAILVGRRTAQIDDPLLTARPQREQDEYGPTVRRVATRVVLDSRARLSSHSQLVKTAGQTPLLVACGPDADEKEMRRLSECGVEVLPFLAATQFERTLQLLDELGRRQVTNLLVEGGAQLLGTLLDARQIDEVHIFVAPKLFGGEQAISPIGGAGADHVAKGLAIGELKCERLGEDVYLHGRLSAACG
ncbi:MAG TPA: bifunctional diaminohydroxyphosphoribosylaminopyrimidine deaminase/5-amino-6-(5-phosphoribosylamino)uracil reductase RibD [Pirellulaceae bacterium]|nr:bifunctional diaminohydroxyphosphoribosylaminopyrimidine deaminase/5-amino-6-(5-phosphoribosylamino)uracil reductase RibD [Pirellulaceae bacterium]